MRYGGVFFCIGTVTLYRVHQWKKKRKVKDKDQQPIDGIVFGETGVNFAYELGITHYMQEHFHLLGYKTAGISGGCQCAFLVVNDLCAKYYFEEFVLKVFEQKEGVTYQNIFDVCEFHLRKMYSNKCTLRHMRNKLYICVTNMFPYMHNVNAHNFKSHSELFAMMKSSQCIPFVFGYPYIVWNQQYWVDGFFTSFRYRPTCGNWIFIKSYHFSIYYYITGFILFHKLFDKSYHEKLFKQGYIDAQRKHGRFVRLGFIEKNS